MSYANGTTHYNLPQTVGSDKRDWFDTNQPFADIDSAIYSAEQTASAVASDVSDLNTALGALGDRVTTAEEDIVTLTGGLATANENIATNSSAITALQTAVGNNKQDLEDMIETNNEASATSAHSYAVGDYFIYNDTLYICTVAIRIGDTIVPNVNCNTTDVMTRVKALEQGGGGGVEIDDTTTSSSKVWSSQKVNDELTLKQDVTDNGLTTTAKTIVGAINELVTGLASKLNSTRLRANGYDGQLAYQGGKYGFTINSTFYALGGGSMPELDFANKVELSTTAMTTSKGGSIVGCIQNPAGSSTRVAVVIDGSQYQSVASAIENVDINFVPSGSELSLSSANNSQAHVYFVPYK